MKPEELYPYIEKNQPNICQISVLQKRAGAFEVRRGTDRECAAAGIAAK